MARGAIATGPVEAVFGEAGKEAAIPLEHPLGRQVLSEAMKSALPDHSAEPQMVNETQRQMTHQQFDTTHNVNFQPVVVRLQMPDGREQLVTVQPQKKMLNLGDPYAGVNYRGAGA